MKFHKRCLSTFSIPWCKKVKNDQKLKSRGGPALERVHTSGKKGLAWKLPSQPSRAKLAWRSRRVSSATADENLVRREHSRLTNFASEVSDRMRRTKTSNYPAFSFFVVLDLTREIRRREEDISDLDLLFSSFLFCSGRCGDSSTALRKVSSTAALAMSKRRADSCQETNGRLFSRQRQI